MAAARPGRVAVVIVLFSLKVAEGAAPAAAQTHEPREVGHELFVHSRFERYARAMQLLGRLDPYPWSIRGLAPGEVPCCGNGEEGHPWRDRITLRETDREGLVVRTVAGTGTLFFNSGFPYGDNDGPLWAGRGLSVSLRGGGHLRYGPLSITVAPNLFWSQNRDVAIAPTGHAGKLAFADPDWPRSIDLPQRFGDSSYARIDAGESTARLDLWGVTTGVSTAAQHWGPAVEHPLILGNNAGGFPHAFLGTSTPVSLWILSLHGRLVWGSLSESEYSPAEEGRTRRFMSGLVGVITPRGVPGLEIGGARFFHTPWPEGGPTARDFLKPLEAFLKEQLPETGEVDNRSDATNQLASIFARWLFPGSGFEVYGELAREDHSWNLRDFLVEPDHNSGYLVGFGKGWEVSGDRWVLLRGEVLNTRVTHLDLVRNQTRFYRHSRTVQGHTQRGQLLGSAAGYGGGAALLSAEVYHPDGQFGIKGFRSLRRQGIGSGDTRLVDVIYGIEGASTWFRGPLEVGAAVTGAYNLNRNFGSDAFNLGVQVEAAWAW